MGAKSEQSSRQYLANTSELAQGMFNGLDGAQLRHVKLLSSEMIDTRLWRSVENRRKLERINRKSEKLRYRKIYTRWSTKEER